MLYRIYKNKDNAQGVLDSNIGASATTIILEPGDGANFPQPYSGTTSSGGTSTTLNKTGIGSSGIAAGDYIENFTDGSSAFVLTVNTDSLVTTELQNGSDNTWQNGDAYRVNPFVGTLNTRNSDGDILLNEKVKVIGRSGDSLTIDSSGGRGFDSSTAQSWTAGVTYFNLFSVSVTHDQYRKAFADLCRQLDTKASIVYVQGLLASRNWKDPVLVATTTNGTLASSFENGDTIDGVVLTTGDRILIKDQTDPKENGIYTVNASGAPTRAVDFDSTAEITAGVVNVTKGTSNADTLWMCTSDSPTIGVNNIVFAQLSAALSKASQAEAQAGTDDTKFMTPAKVIDSLKTNRFIAHGGNGSDGDLTVSGTTTLNLNQVYNFNNVTINGTLTFTGSGSIALINIAGNLSGSGTIELRNTSSGDPSVEYLTADGRLSGGNSAQATAPNTGGSGGTTNAGAGAGGVGGASTAVGTGTGGAAGVTAGGAGGAGGGGNSTGGGGGGGGGASNGTNGTAGSAASGNNGGTGGAGAASTGANACGGGGGGGGGWNTGSGGAGGAAGAATSVSAGYTMPRGGNGGASGANGGNGGAGGNSGTVSLVSPSLTFTAAKGGDGGWGYSNGGAGGQGSGCTYTGALSNIVGVLGAGGDGGHSTYGTGGNGGAGGDSQSTNHSSGSGPTGATGGTGGNGRTGGAGGRGSNITGSSGNLTGGNGGAGGNAKSGCAALYIAVRGNSTFNGTINGQGGNGGAGGQGGQSMGTASNSNGGNGGDASKGADVMILTLGTCATPTVNNLGGTGGAGGAPGIGGSGIPGPTNGLFGTKGKDGANGIKIIQQLLI